MHFGEPLEEARLIELLRPGNGIDTVLSADTYGSGDADSLLGRALAGVNRDSYSLVGAVGHDFYEGERQGPKGFPRFTDTSLRSEDEYAGYLRMAAERSLERIGVDRFDLLLLHNPDRTGFTSEAVWSGMAALRDEGLAKEIGVAPGPANGFTLDLIDCFERFGSLLDWAMVILNPLEPWPGEMVLAAAESAGIDVITRVVDYGGLFWGDVDASTPLPDYDHRRFRPEGWIDVGAAKIERLREITDRLGLTPMQLACAWNLAHPAVDCVVPTLIQESGPGARPIEEKRAELASLPERTGLTEPDVSAIRAIGDNTGSMALKGANPQYDGPEAADRWGMSDELTAVAERSGIDPARDLAQR
jgi:aryl-alcohol dehydrogenase-like predicted oxidoreductase